MKPISIFGLLVALAVTSFLNSNSFSQEKKAEASPLPLGILIEVKPRMQAYIKVRNQQISELASKYERVIESRFSKAASVGDLKMAKAFQVEKERIGSLVKLLAAGETDPFTAAQRSDTLPDFPSGTPEALVTLRKIWTTEWQKIRSKLDGEIQQSLKALEVKFTKARDIGNAEKILAYRESLLSGSPVVIAATANQKKSLVSSPVTTSKSLLKARAHFVVKGEAEMFINGKKLRFRNEADDKQYIDAITSPLDLNENDIVVIRVRSEAGFRGVIFAFKEESGDRTIPFPASVYRLLKEGNKTNVKELDAQALLQSTAPGVSKMNPDVNMNRMWKEHGIPYAQFVLPREQGVWSTWAIVVTPDMIKGK